MFYLFHWFRSFLPLHNPIGFGGIDFIELTAAFLLTGFALTSAWWIRLAHRIASRTAWCMLLLAILPIALRLLLLPVHPIPAPAVADDFSYLLQGDTFSHFRLANPVHPFHSFFETFFVLQQPSYSSVYPPGQGIALAIGQVIFRSPWAGVALSIGAMCALSYWMLRAWVSPMWALLGGLFAVMQFGPLNQWMNSYWGGAVSAIAGCLVFGALPRLRQRGGLRNSLLLGAGLGLQFLTRPFEFVFLTLSVCLYFLFAFRKPGEWRRVVSFIPAIVLAMLPAIALTLFHDQRVTGHWLMLPNALSRYQYGVPAAFTPQPNPTPHRELTREQQLDYQLQSAVHGPGTETVHTYFTRLGDRLRFYRFFLLAPLYLALPFFFATLRTWRHGWVFLTILVFAGGTTFYPYFYSHYIAAITCLFLLIGVVGLQQLSRLSIHNYPFGRDAAGLLVFLCAAHFVFWYGLHLAGNTDFASHMWSYETWDAVNYGDPEGRLFITHELNTLPGKKLVFVKYSSRHTFKEWVYNAADIDHSDVVWARDLGSVEDDALRRYYSDRSVWRLEPDAHPIQLQPYETPPILTAPTASPAIPAQTKHKPTLKFEEVH